MLQSNPALYSFLSFLLVLLHHMFSWITSPINLEHLFNVTYLFLSYSEQN